MITFNSNLTVNLNSMLKPTFIHHYDVRLTGNTISRGTQWYGSYGVQEAWKQFAATSNSYPSSEPKIRLTRTQVLGVNSFDMSLHRTYHDATFIFGVTKSHRIVKDISNDLPMCRDDSNGVRRHIFVVSPVECIAADYFVEELLQGISMKLGNVRIERPYHHVMSCRFQRMRSSSRDVVVYRSTIMYRP